MEAINRVPDGVRQRVLLTVLDSNVSKDVSQEYAERAKPQSVLAKAESHRDHRPKREILRSDLAPKFGGKCTDPVEEKEREQQSTQLPPQQPPQQQKQTPIQEDQQPQQQQGVDGADVTSGLVLAGTEHRQRNTTPPLDATSAPHPEAASRIPSHRSFVASGPAIAAPAGGGETERPEQPAPTAARLNHTPAPSNATASDKSIHRDPRNDIFHLIMEPAAFEVSTRIGLTGMLLTNEVRL